VGYTTFALLPRFPPKGQVVAVTCVAVEQSLWGPRILISTSTVPLVHTLCIIYHDRAKTRFSLREV